MAENSLWPPAADLLAAALEKVKTELVAMMAYVRTLEDANAQLHVELAAAADFQDRVTRPGKVLDDKGRPLMQVRVDDFAWCQELVVLARALCRNDDLSHDAQVKELQKFLYGG